MRVCHPCACGLLSLSLSQVVAGALVEGDDEGDEDAPDGNAGSWFKVEMMLEEVRSKGVATQGVVKRGKHMLTDRQDLERGVWGACWLAGLWQDAVAPRALPCLLLLLLMLLCVCVCVFVSSRLFHPPCPRSLQSTWTAQRLTVTSS